MIRKFLLFGLINLCLFNGVFLVHAKSSGVVHSKKKINAKD